MRQLAIINLLFHINLKHTVRNIISLFLILLTITPALSQTRPDRSRDLPEPTTRILFVFDASQSMYARWQSDMRINIARRLLNNLLDSLENVDNVELALRVFGHQKQFPPQDCDDTALEIPFAPNNVPRIKNKLRTIVPRGTTPIAKSLEKAANDFPHCDNRRNIIILITDGIEECGGDPCAASRELQEKGIVLRPFVIGIGRDFRADFECVGEYYDASSEEQFVIALNAVITQILNQTTAQVNLLDIYGNPTESNVNMSFYDYYSGALRYNFIHTMNHRGNPDTLVIDHLTTYKMVVHTIPPVQTDSFKLTLGKHNIIAVDAPQGYLMLKVAGRPLYRGLQAIIRKNNSMETLNVQDFDNVEKYLVGTYDIEVLCLPRMHINNVEVAQNSTTTVEIPQPGIAVIQKPASGYGSLYVEEGHKLRLIYNLQEGNTQESIILQPGSYRVVFRPKHARRSINTVERSFIIESGRTETVRVFM